MHEYQDIRLKKSALLIRTQSSRLLSLAEFDWPFQTARDEQNRWAKMKESIPWDDLVEAYYKAFPVRRGDPLKMPDWLSLQ